MTTESTSASPPLRQSTVWLMATTVGVVVANIYYAQPLLADIAHSFGLSVTRAGAIAMLSQAGTATGMLLFVPLGDKFERRRLITILLLGAFVASSAAPVDTRQGSTEFDIKRLAMSCIPHSLLCK